MIYKKYSDKNKLKAQLWVYWDNMNAFTESLKVGNVVIKPNMTFNQFKTFFPISAQKSEAHFKNLYMQEGTYHVLVINIPISEVEEPPYVPSVAFTFKKGKLNKLAILSGVAC